MLDNKEVESKFLVARICISRALQLKTEEGIKSWCISELNFNEEYAKVVARDLYTKFVGRNVLACQRSTM